MKSLKDFLNEVAAPVAGDEIRFMDKHTVVVFDYSFGNDNAFTGNVEKDMTRLADYKFGTDVAVYESAITIEPKKPYDNINDAEKCRHKKEEIKKKIIDENFDVDEILNMAEELDDDSYADLLNDILEYVENTSEDHK